MRSKSQREFVYTNSISLMHVSIKPSTILLIYEYEYFFATCVHHYCWVVHHHPKKKLRIVVCIIKIIYLFFNASCHKITYCSVHHKLFSKMCASLFWVVLLYKKLLIVVCIIKIFYLCIHASYHKLLIVL
jgi:hypothetical protein